MFYGSGVLCKGMANRREKSLASKAQIQQALHCRCDSASDLTGGGPREWSLGPYSSLGPFQLVCLSPLQAPYLQPPCPTLSRIPNHLTL